MGTMFDTWGNKMEWIVFSRMELSNSAYDTKSKKQAKATTISF